MQFLVIIEKQWNSMSLNYEVESFACKPRNGIIVYWNINIFRFGQTTTVMAMEIFSPCQQGLIAVSFLVRVWTSCLYSSFSPRTQPCLNMFRISAFCNSLYELTYIHIHVHVHMHTHTYIAILFYLKGTVFCSSLSPFEL